MADKIQDNQYESLYNMRMVRYICQSVVRSFLKGKEEKLNVIE